MSNQSLETIKKVMSDGEAVNSRYIKANEGKFERKFREMDPNNIFGEHGVMEVLRKIIESGLVKSSENADGSFVPAVIYSGDVTYDRYVTPNTVIQLLFNFKANTQFDKDFDYITIRQRQYRDKMLKGLTVDYREVDENLSLEEAIGLALASPGHFDYHYVPSENDNSGDMP